VSTALDTIAREERLSCSPVALRRYLVERFGEPAAVSDGEPALFDEEPETASLSVSVATAVTSVDQPVDVAAFAETVAAPAERRKHGALLLALAAAASLAVIPALAADGETSAPAIVAAPPREVEPSPPPAAVGVTAPLPIPVAVEAAPAPRASARKRRAPPVAKSAAWDPDGPLLRSQQRRKRR
jgi:hypothetical protein